MYTLVVQNNYKWNIEASNGDIISVGYSNTFNNQGSLYLTVPGIGQISFIDLADKKLDGYPIPKETWGVLVRIHTTEAYYRYEGGGQLHALIDQYGSFSLSTTNGEIISISLPELTIF